MKFLYPLGLLGLIGIPILIIIYIIKSKYAEITVSSTYIWRLSEKFLKRRNPLNKLTGIISLILQLLIITVISFAIAHPIIILPDAANEYCFIIDGSASMLMTDDNGTTRFDYAKDKIEDVINSSGDGSVYSLIYVGESTRTVYERMESRDTAKQLLSELEPSYNACDFSDAIGKAQMMFERNSSTLNYVVTDKTFNEINNAELLYVGNDCENYALSDVKYSLLTGMLTVNGTLISYVNDADVELELYLDGSSTPVALQSYSVKAGVDTQFTLACTCENFSSFKVKIATKDAFSLDNEVAVFNAESEKSYKTLIVSDTPFFFESIIKSITNSEVTVMSTEEYDGETGYGLYVFESYVLETLPRDGAVWFVNPRNSVPNADFSFQGTQELEKAEILTMTKSSSSIVASLTEGVIGNDIYINQYAKCSPGRNFTTLLSYNGSPMLFAGTNSYGNREVVFAYNIHASDAPLSWDYIAFVRNFIKYSFPEIIEESMYSVGEKLQVNVISNCESIRIDSPSGKVEYLDTGASVASSLISEVGAYDITVMISGSEREFSVYSVIPKSERVPISADESFNIQGEKGNGGFDGEFDPMMILFISLVVLFVADWGVYCYEKYQLR